MENKNTVIRLSEQQAQQGDTKNLHAHVVDSNGNIIESVPFRNNEAQLASSPDDLKGTSKVYIAPPLPEGLTAARRNERTLSKAGAYSPLKDFSGNLISIPHLPDDTLRPFPLLRPCLVKGNVSKYFITDGKTERKPLCSVKVHVCEVDSELLVLNFPVSARRIPDSMLLEVAGKIRQTAVSQFPGFPKPVGPDPAPDRVSTEWEKVNLPLSNLGTSNTSALSNQFRNLPPLPDHVTEALNTTSADSIRKTLYEYHPLFYPYFCLWPFYWPWFYKTHEESFVYTDCEGNFQLTEFRTLSDSAPDVYIWIEAFIDGGWQVVYKPPVPCRTYWNYACNTDINITLTQYNTSNGVHGESLYDRLTSCSCDIKLDPGTVWFRSVGDKASALRIEQTKDSSVTLQDGKSLNNRGCSDIVSNELNQKISPFGGILALNIGFGTNTVSSGITHYRWKRTQLTDAYQQPVPGDPAPVIIDGDVLRYYWILKEDLTKEWHACSLGAEHAGNDIAYRIPNDNPAQEPQASLQLPGDAGRPLEWVQPGYFTSAYINTLSPIMNDGIWQLELELLKRDGDKFVVVPVPADKKIFQISSKEVTDTVQFIGDDAINTYLNRDKDGSIISFKIIVRIDNNPCHVVKDPVTKVARNIHPVALGDTEVISDACGFIHYNNPDDQLRLSFNASHPTNFASFSYRLYKGNGNLPMEDVSTPRPTHKYSYVISDIDDFILSNGDFHKDVPVSKLLEGCAGQAAFSEVLDVTALATNGTYRLEAYDVHVVSAFAISDK